MRLIQASVFIGLVSGAAFAVQAPMPQPAGEWPSFGRDPGAMRYSPLTQINTNNVSQLRLVWTYDTAAPLTPPSEGEGGRHADDAAAPANRSAPSASAAADGTSAGWECHRSPVASSVVRSVASPPSADTRRRPELVVPKMTTHWPSGEKNG
jgi:hypothetical protein